MTRHLRSKQVKQEAGGRAGGFTLIELLIAIAIIGFLISILLPAMSAARQSARITRAHSDLRQVMIGLDGYLMNNADHVPPSRSACGTTIYDQLPVELSNQYFLPPSPNRIPQAHMIDVFSPTGETYKYRAPGGIWFNGTFFDTPDQPAHPRSLIWVPDDFPANQSAGGKYYGNLTGEPPCPAKFVLWSIGPDPKSAKFPRNPILGTVVNSQFPLPAGFWLMRSTDTGLITHFQGRTGFEYVSP